MRLRILLIAFVSTVVAQQRNVQRPTRAPQAQIKYHDPNGLKVDWKFFAPQNQWRSHLQSSQQPQQHEASATSQQPTSPHGQSQPQLVPVEPNHFQQASYAQHQAQPEAQPQLNLEQLQYKTYVQPQVAEAHPDPSQTRYNAYAPQPRVQVEAEPDPNQIQYNRYTTGPAHVKQVVLENFKPQRPYANPSSLLYSQQGAVPQQYEQQLPNSDLNTYEQPAESQEQVEQQKSRRDYSESGLQGRIIYREEYERRLQLRQQQQQQQQEQQLQQQQQQYEPQVEHIPVPIETLPAQPVQQLLLDKSMPSEIQQLLQYQARIPYDVIANSINYKPKTLFVPKPLPSEGKGPYHYRSKIYYLNNDGHQADDETSKPVEEEHRH